MRIAKARDYRVEIEIGGRKQIKRFSCLENAALFYARLTDLERIETRIIEDYSGDEIGKRMLRGVLLDMDLGAAL